MDFETICKVWSLMKHHYRIGLTVEVPDDYVADVKEYVLAHYDGISREDMMHLWKLYIDWISFDMDYQGECSARAYIYLMWDKNVE